MPRKAGSFYEQIVFIGDCWEWAGERSEHGYGRIKRNGVRQMAHRYVYERLVGPIPEGLELDHLCRNRACVNPDHLEPVTRRENILRGEGFASRQARATHCPQGHEYAGENLRYTTDKDGARRRVCRACNRERGRRYEARKRRLRDEGENLAP